MQWQTGDGIFKPGGRGGGIFDGNLSGLGTLASPHGRPRRRRMLHGLGAVPAACWDVPGFKDCHDEQFKKAQTFCFAQTDQWLKDRGYTDRDACIKQTDSAYTDANCVSSMCPSSSGASAPAVTQVSAGQYPWAAYSADTLALQRATNIALKQNGFCSINEDGKLGGQTCGARLALRSAIPGMSYPSTCQKFTAPKLPPCGSAVVSTSPALTPQAVTAAQMQFGTSTNWTKYVAFAAGALLVVGGLYWINKRKG